MLEKHKIFIEKYKIFIQNSVLHISHLLCLHKQYFITKFNKTKVGKLTLKQEL